MKIQIQDLFTFYDESVPNDFNNKELYMLLSNIQDLRGTFNLI